MIFTEYRKPDFSDDSTVQNAFALYEKFLTQHKYLADDNITLAGKYITPVVLKKLKFGFLLKIFVENFLSLHLIGHYL